MSRPGPPSRWHPARHRRSTAARWPPQPMRQPPPLPPGPQPGPPLCRTHLRRRCRSSRARGFPGGLFWSQAHQIARLHRPQPPPLSPCHCHLFLSSLQLRLPTSLTWVCPLRPAPSVCRLPLMAAACSLALASPEPMLTRVRSRPCCSRLTSFYNEARMGSLGSSTAELSWPGEHLFLSLLCLIQAELLSSSSPHLLPGLIDLLPLVRTYEKPFRP